METLNLYNKGLTIHHQITNCWYAIYTKPNHEKEVYRQLQDQSIRSYLPLYTTVRQWSKRKKKLSIPLFNCYVFVNISIRDYCCVLKLSEVVRCNSFERKAESTPEKLIKMALNMLKQKIELEIIRDSLQNGTNVKIIAGSLNCIVGKLIDFAAKKRVVSDLMLFANPW
jgi:transcription antitermination factor NusG